MSHVTHIFIVLPSLLGNRDLWLAVPLSEALTFLSICGYMMKNRHTHQGYLFFIYTQIMYIHTVLYVEVKLYVIALIIVLLCRICAIHSYSKNSL